MEASKCLADTFAGDALDKLYLKLMRPLGFFQRVGSSLKSSAQNEVPFFSPWSKKGLGAGFSTLQQVSLKPGMMRARRT